MRTAFKTSRLIATALLTVGVALSGCAGPSSAPSPELQQRIERASTPADHESLATYYTQEAAKARAQASEHRRMAKSYQGIVNGGRGTASMPAHCNAIVASFENIATEYDLMAVAHQQLAKQAKP